jgi:hypothetical protein
MNATFVKSISTESTGGNVMNDIITLDDSKIIVISNDMIGYYNSLESYENNEEPTYFIERYN